MRGMARLCVPVLLLGHDVHRHGQNEYYAPKMFGKKFCFALEMFKQKSSFALQTFEQKSCFAP